MTETPVQTWDFKPEEILASTRKVQGIFHQPIIDKDGELISPKGMREAVPDFMHLPALHDFHKERPVGLATKVMELPGGRFYFEGVIKSTSDCDDIWEKVKTGNYDQVSIFGKRTKYNNQCALPQNMRSGPCITDGVRLDSISVCDDNARNPQTSLEVKKANVVFDADTFGRRWARNAEGTFVEITKGKTDWKEAEKLDFERGADKKYNFTGEEHDETETVREIRAKRKKKGEVNKAETTSSNLQHASTDYADEKDMEKSVPKTGGKKSVLPHADNLNIHANKHNEREWAEGNYEQPGVKHYTKHPHTTVGTGRDTRSRDGGVDYAGKKVRISKCPCPKEANIISKDVEKADEPPTTGDKGATQPKVNPKKHPASSRHAGNPVFEHEAHKQNPPEQGNKGGIVRVGVAPKSETREIENRTAAAQAIGHYEVEAIRNKYSGNPVAPREGQAKKKVGHRLGTSTRKAGDEMDDMEKGVRPTITEEPIPYKKKEKGNIRPAKEGDKRVEKGSTAQVSDDMGNTKDFAEVEKSAADDLEDENYDEDEDKDFKHVKHTDKEGEWSEEGDPNGTVKMKKAQEKGKPEKHPDKEDEEEDEYETEEVEEEEEEVEKGTAKDVTHHKGIKSGLQQTRTEATPRTKQTRGNTDYEIRQNRRDNPKDKYGHPMSKNSWVGKKLVDHNPESRLKKGDEDAASESFNPSTVTKGEQMDEQENDVEYVTKALVPIEEIDTIVKARTEEISKAYMGQLDEIKKAYDAKFVELSSKLEKMETETIRKGGQVVVIPELLGGSTGGSMSNADAIARMQAGR